MAFKVWGALKATCKKMSAMRLRFSSPWLESVGWTTAPNQKYLFARNVAHEAPADSLSKLTLPAMPSTVMPLAYAVPVQLIAYHTAFVMGKDVDQPRSVASRSPWNDRR